MYSLGNLADPEQLTSPLEIDQADDEFLIKSLEMMYLIRRTEECMADLIKSGEINCPCHLAIGQEAISVGVAHNLNNKDRVFGNHRSHAQYLALGGSVEELLAEVLGKVTGCSKGMGGSMHLYSGTHGFHGSVPLVAGTIPIAVGAGLAAKFDKNNAVGVAFFGDGACEEGILHECLNIASIMKLPVIFVVENNLYSSHLDIQQRQPFDSVARFASPHNVASRVVDGNDVVAVEKASRELIQAARNGQGPGFLEAITFRWLGHVGPNEDIDVGVRRSSTELQAWKKRDPILRLFKALETRGTLSLESYKNLMRNIDKLIDDAKDKALLAPWPSLENLNNFVYASSSA